MKKCLVVMLIAILSLSTAVFAATLQDQNQHAACSYCGMDRVKFAHTRMLIEYEDGSSTGTCSLHCAAIELAVSISKTPAAIMVGDYNSQQLLNAESASWVLGGEKRGVMTSRAKWAFADKAAAKAFIKDHGGSLTDFESAIKAAYEDMYQDSNMIRKMRKQKKMKMKMQQQHKMGS